MARLFPSLAHVPDPIPPGVSVVASGEPGRVAALLAARLTHAIIALDRTDAARAVEARAGADLDAARWTERATRVRLVGARTETAAAEAGAALAELAGSPAAVAPETVSDLAAALLEATTAATDARAGLGPRPGFDLGAANVAQVKVVRIDDAFARRRALRSRRLAVAVTAGNLTGLTLLVLAALTGRGELTSLRVTALVAAAVASPLAALVLARRRLGRADAEVRAAILAAGEALRRAGVRSPRELEARRAEVEAWEARAQAADDAATTLAECRAAWRAVAGDLDPVDAPTLVAASHRLAAARAELAQAAADHAEASAEVAAAEQANRPLVLLDAAPMSLAVLGRIDDGPPVVLVTADPMILLWAGAVHAAASAPRPALVSPATAPELQRAS